MIQIISSLANLSNGAKVGLGVFGIVTAAGTATALGAIHVAGKVHDAESAVEIAKQRTYTAEAEAAKASHELDLAKINNPKRAKAAGA
jgi:ABC-type cobalamin transport system ATPase subunit